MADKAPTYLNERTYPAVERRMLGLWPNMPGAATTMTDSPYDPATWAPDKRFEPARFDISLSRQLYQVMNPADALSTDTEAPSAYLFTAYSALPVSAAIRAFYLSAGGTVPLLDRVVTKSSVIHDQTETRRLTGRIAGLHTVCIVDQYINRGRTLEKAASIAYAAGADRVVAIRGSWYEDARSSFDDVATPNGTDHEAFFMQVGRKAYHAYQTYSEHFTRT